MSRLIEADRLKKVLEKNFGHTGGADVLRQLIDAQPTANPEPNWIPVTERLPEESGLYQVTDMQGNVVRYIFGEGSEEYWKRCVKAWMPLPEPYRG